MATYRVTVRRPGAAARDEGDDLRVSVTFGHTSMPMPVTFHFLNLVDEETGEHEFRHVGLEIGEQPPDLKGHLAMPELTAITLRHLVERYPKWLELAQAHAAVDFDRAREVAPALKRIKPARLDRNWYRMIADEYRRHVEEGEPAPVTTIARSHGVTPSAASRWVKAARTEGFLDD
jgi:hypothetical protein